MVKLSQGSIFLAKSTRNEAFEYFPDTVTCLLRILFFSLEYKAIISGNCDWQKDSKDAPINNRS